MKMVVKLLISALVISSTGSLWAASITNDSGLAAPVSTVTFDEIVFSQGTEITDQYVSYGITFESLVYYDSQGNASFPGVETHYVGNNSTPLINPFSISFTSTQTAAAFGIATNPATTTFTAKLNGVVVESYQSSTDFDDPSISFQGFEGISFDEIEISVGGDGQALIDNIQMGVAAPPPLGDVEPVPSNAAWAMGALILLLVSFGFIAINRRFT